MNIPTSNYLQWWCSSVLACCLAMVMTGCGGSREVDAEFMRQVNDTKAQTTASKVKAAALPLFSKLDKDTKVPNEILSLPFFKEEGGSHVGVGRVENDKALFFMQGGGFASQGIIVCFADDALKGTTLRGTIIRWEDGVYFWADWRVVHGVDKKDVMLRRE